MIRLQTLMTALMLALALLFGTVSGHGALAQDATATATETPAEQTQTDKLIDVLQDDATRAKLIDALRSLDDGTSAPVADGAEAASGDTAVEAAATEAASAVSDDASVGRQIATFTKVFAEDIIQEVQQTWKQTVRSLSNLSALGGTDSVVLTDAFRDLGLLIVATVGVFLVLRGVAQAFYARLGAKAAESRFLRTVGLFMFSGVVDVLNVLVAWLVGYILALTVFGSFGEIGIRQTLYLNAFVLVELIKVVVRMVFSPASSALRILPLSDTGAKFTARRLSLLIGLIGYGQLLVIPVINGDVSFAAGRAATLVLALLVLLITIFTVLRKRGDVASWLLGQDEELAPRGAARVLARNWHWPVLLYLAGVFVIVMTRSSNVVFATFVNSAQVALVVLVGIIASGAMTRIVRKGISLPDTITGKLPALEGRLNTFVPKLLMAVRALIILFVILFALNALGVLSLGALLASEFGAKVSGTVVSVLFIMIVSTGIWLALSSWVDYRLNPEWGSVPTSRETTLLTLLRNAATIALVIITLMFVLAEIGLDIAPLLASAGVLGLAIGFGSQKMVQDIITGIFIQFEGVINVGDVITLNGTTGVVEKLTIRSVSLRDYQGAYHMIPFSSVDMVSNFMKDYGYFVCDMGVAYRESVSDVKEAMFAAFEELVADPEHRGKIMGDMEWSGLNTFGDSAIILRSKIKCYPGEQWNIGRAYNEIVKRIFDERGIEIPYPYQTLTFAESKAGESQPVRVKMEEKLIEGTARETTREDPPAKSDRPKKPDIPAQSDTNSGDGPDGDMR
jgi:small conductance mechanosensitive channel